MPRIRATAVPKPARSFSGAGIELYVRPQFEIYANNTHATSSVTAAGLEVQCFPNLKTITFEDGVGDTSYYGRESCVEEKMNENGEICDYYEPRERERGF
jgi:hypothetical protein